MMSFKSRSLFFFLCDLIILFLVFSLTSFIITYTGHDNPMSGVEISIYGIFSFLLLLMFFIEGIYTLETFEVSQLPVSLIRGSAFALILSVSIFSIISIYFPIRSPMFLIINSLTLPYLIYLVRSKLLLHLSQDQYLRETILIGSMETLKLAQGEANRRPFLGFKVRNTYTPEDLVAENFPTNTHLIAVENTLLHKFTRPGIEIMDIACFAEQVSGKVPLSSISESWLLDHNKNRDSYFYRFAKSTLDKSIALTLMIALIPVAVLLFPILLLVHGRPIFFKQSRTGLNDKEFTLYKLRSMIVNAESNGAQWSKPGDVRITPLGKWLRKTRLDELPQLYNILKGDMSLVGPRPERPEIIKNNLAPEIPLYHLRHLVKPGVTGWAQVAFRYGYSTEDSKEKLQYDLFYIKNRSFLLDVIIIIKTIKTVLTGAGQ